MTFSPSDRIIIRSRVPEGPAPGPVTLIDVWYNRSARTWTIQAKDANGFQIGDSDFSGTRDGAAHSAGVMASEHGAPVVWSKAS